MFLDTQMRSNGQEKELSPRTNSMVRICGKVSTTWITRVCRFVMYQRCLVPTSILAMLKLMLVLYHPMVPPPISHNGTCTVYRPTHQRRLAILTLWMLRDQLYLPPTTKAQTLHH